jgi:DNA-binding LacI/PurR family transcriptional regulator
VAAPTGRARPTIRDVAAAAGVSISTASAALRGTGRVNQETRARVAATAERLGYRVSRAARNLRLGRNGSLAVVLPHEEYPVADFYMAFAPAAARRAMHHGASLTLVPAERVIAGEVGDLIDGAIIVDPATNDARLMALELAGIPWVTLDRDLGRAPYPQYTGGDNSNSTRRLLDHLAAGGARRIVLLSADATWSWLHDTEAAYGDWVTERRQERLVARLDFSGRPEHTQLEVEHVLMWPDRPDAILAVADQFALAASLAAKNCGLHVPDDLQLAALVDGSAAQSADPPITVVDPSAERFGSLAVDMLVDVIAGDPPSEPTIVPGTLVVRASTRARE